MGMCVSCVFESAVGDEAAAPVVRPPVQAGEYELLEEIARGGMGVVWRARHRRLGREVALKFVREPLLPGEDGSLRFQNEAQAAAQLRHPHIVTVHEVGEADGRWFLSMELVSGGTLADRMKRAPLDARGAAALLAKVARAVQHAHERGILHRDLKPANILLDAEGEPRVTDFGLARLSERDCSLTLSGVLMGTPAYISPEQAAGIQRAITPASDVYSLGAILYECLAGRPPFVADTQFELLRSVMDEEPQRPASVRQGTDRDLEIIALKCLDKNPAARYASALALAQDLERWLAGKPISARAVSRMERVKKWARRHPAVASLWTALALALVAVGVTGWLFYDAHQKAQAAQLPSEEEGRFGSPLVDRWENDSNAGTLVVLSTPVSRPGRVTEWSFFDNDTPGHKVTPLLFEALPGDRYALRGIGTTRTSDASGVQSFPFGLIAGSDTAGPQTCVGFMDMAVEAMSGGVLNATGHFTGVIDGSFYGGGSWLFTPGIGYTPALDIVFHGPRSGESGALLRLDAGRVYSAQFRVE